MSREEFIKTRGAECTQSNARIALNMFDHFCQGMYDKTGEEIFYQTPNVWDLSLVSREGVFTALTISIITIIATTAIPIHSNTIYYPYTMILEKPLVKTG